MSESSAPRLLVVEDSPTQAIKLRLTLEREGYAVACVASAEQALESMNEWLPALVVADFHLPGMNGDWLVQQIRLNVRTRIVPLLLLTEAQEPDIERHGLESGADAYVSKSAATDILLLRIKSLLRRRQDRPGEVTASGRAAESRLRPTRILLVDLAGDAGLSTLFAREAYDLTWAASTAEAVAALERSTDFDCVIVTVPPAAAPALELAQALEALRGNTGAPHDFIIVGLSEGDTALRAAYAAGFDDLITGTHDVESVRLRIRALVRRKRVADDNKRIELELRDRDLAIQLAQEQAAASQTKAALAEELATANRDLEGTNQRLRDMQSQLVHAAKMASLGELVAGIAHEINNPLSFILAHQGTVERLLRDNEAADADAAEGRRKRALERLQAMQLGLKRIQDLVLNLRKFSRFDGEAFQTVDVPASLETMLALLAHKLGPRVRVERRFAGARDLQCSPALLNQVVTNIVGNAADAVSEGGTVTIETASDDDLYTIEIGDSGPGVPPGLRERIFEPFFTTKPVGSGTGLGLAISYSVVLAHKGTITVDDRPGGGAVFKIQVPRRQA